VIPQLLWFRAVRANLAVVFVVTLVINVGMWFERFVIICTTLQRDFLPSSWADFSPTLLDLGTFVGSFGLFFTLFLLFCRLVPMIAMAEVKAVAAHQPKADAGKGGAT